MTMPRSAAAVLLAALCLTGCTVSVKTTTPRVSTAELQRSVTSALQRSVGRAPQRVDCPNPVDARVGAKTRCVLTDHGLRAGVTVTVKSVQGTRAQFDVQVDNHPLK